MLYYNNVIQWLNKNCTNEISTNRDHRKCKTDWQDILKTYQFPDDLQVGSQVFVDTEHLQDAYVPEYNIHDVYDAWCLQGACVEPQADTKKEEKNCAGVPNVPDVSHVYT